MTRLPPNPFAHRVAFETERPIRYIENKHVDHAMVQDLLAYSARANQWSNFGPVCHLLEEKLTQALDVSPQLEVVACSNATVGLHALVAMHNHLNDKPLRWVTSAFGFYSSCDGILCDARIVDCDSHGMLDLELLQPDEFDGFVVTNLFGQYKNLNAYRDYAEKHQKILLIDAAMGFHAGDHSPNECISLHHTKPWGFGEGGCVIVDRRHAALLRDLLAFGHHAPDAPINRLACNGKISDVSCAYILMRLSELERFREGYQIQHQRIADIGMGLGLTLLGGNAGHPGVPANVPFLFPEPAALANDPVIPARKYYFPLAQTPMATDIYRRIINVACHSEMAQLPDAAIEAFLLQCR